MTLEENRPLASLTSLCAGGAAERFAVAYSVDDLAELAAVALMNDWPVTLLGFGSNVLVSDDGIKGLVILNRTGKITISESGCVEVESGAAFQDLFLKTAQAGLHGFEYAVGIPGSVGGALVSNAGAYRAEISEFLEALEVWENGARAWVGPQWMQFGYRDSRLRREHSSHAPVLLQARFQLPTRPACEIYKEARDYQKQRISKQPPSASAGSFFKNVISHDLAFRLESLPEPLKQKGIIPAGYLIESVGLKGYRHGPVGFGSRHANFILNLGGGTAAEIRNMAELGKARVNHEHGVMLEEEVLYLGDWSAWEAARG